MEDAVEFNFLLFLRECSTPMLLCLRSRDVLAGAKLPLHAPQQLTAQAKKRSYCYDIS